MPRKPANMVLLNGVEYICAGPVLFQNIHEWATSLRTTGDLKRSDRTLAADWVIEDQTGGIGLWRSMLDSPREKYWYGDLWTLHPGKMTLPPLLQDTASTGASTKIYFVRRLNGSFYCAENNLLRKWSGSAWTNVAATSFPASFKPTDARVFWDGTNHRIVIAYELTDGSATGFIHSTSGDDGSWTAVALGTGTGTNVHMTEFEGKLLFHTSQNKIYWTTDLVTVNNFQPMASSPTGTNIGIWLDDQGRRTPYVCTQVGPYILDFYAQKIMPAVGLPDTMTEWSSNGKIFDSINSYFWISTEYGLLRVSSGGAVSDIFESLPHGLPTGWEGTLFKALPYRNNVIIAKGDKTPWIGVWNGSGIHPILIGSSGTNIEDMDIGPGSDASTVVLFLAYGTTVKQMVLPAASLDLTRYSGFKFAASGYQYTPWFEGNLPELDAGWFKSYTGGENFTANETLTLAYLKDYNYTEIAAGVIDSNGETFEYSDFSAKAVRLKLTMARAAGDNTKSPTLHFLNTKYLKQSNDKYGFQFEIDLKRTARRAGQNVAHIVNGLMNLYENDLTFALTYGPFVSRWVKLQSLGGNLDFGGSRGLQVGETGEGRISVRFVEVV